MGLRGPAHITTAELCSADILCGSPEIGNAGLVLGRRGRGKS